MNRRAVIHLVIVAALLVVYVTTALDVSPRHGLTGDARQYMTAAYNLIHHRTFSSDREYKTKPVPDAHRSPGYPAFAALCLSITGEARDVSLEAFLDHRLYGFARCQVVLNLLTALLAGASVWLITRRAPWVYATVLLVAFNSKLLRIVGRMLSEPLICFLLTALSFALLLTVVRKRPWTFALLGIAHAFTALTRASFQYMWLFVVLFFLVLWRAAPGERKSILRGTLCYLAVYVLIVGGWMTRNYVRFGRPFIADRGGSVLSIRAAYDTMPLEDALASFAYWGKGDFFEARTKQLPEEVVARFDRQKSTSYYAKGKRTARRKRAEYGSDRAGADKELMKEAKAQILRHPVRHLLVTIPLAYRGMFVDDWEKAVPMFLLTFALFFTSLCRKNERVLAFLLPGAYMYTFNCLLTHNKSRYNVPLIPVLIASTVLVIYYVAPRVISRIKARSKAGRGADSAGEG